MSLKILLLVVLTALTFIHPNSANAYEKMGTSIFIYAKFDFTKSTLTRRQYLEQELIPGIRQLKKTVFANSSVDVFIENSFHGFKTIAANAIRTHFVESVINHVNGLEAPPDYHQPIFRSSVDLMIRIQLPSGEVSDEQTASLRMLRASLQEVSSLVSISRTLQYNFFTSPKKTDSDVQLAFTIGWRPDLGTREQNQHYWRENHGGYVVSLGLPTSVLSYIMQQTDILQPTDDGTYDTELQGLALMTIRREVELLKMSINPKVIAFNIKLIIDEQRFTTTPQLLLFKKVDIDLPSREIFVKPWVN